jgi:hypothetical protein
MMLKENRPVEVTGFNFDLLKTILSFDSVFCNHETIRRAMFGKFYPGWDLDSRKISVALFALKRGGFVKRTSLGVKLTPKGLSEVVP